MCVYYLRDMGNKDMYVKLTSVGYRKNIIKTTDSNKIIFDSLKNI